MLGCKGHVDIALTSKEGGANRIAQIVPAGCCKLLPNLHDVAAPFNIGTLAGRDAIILPREIGSMLPVTYDV